MADPDPLAVLAAARKKLGIEPDPAEVLARARAALATTPEQRQLGHAVFGTDDLLAAMEQPGTVGFFHDDQPDAGGPADAMAARPYGFRNGELRAAEHPKQVKASQRKARVAVEQEQPRLSERITPDNAGLTGTLGAMAQDVENVVRGLPSGAVTGLGQLAADAVGGQAFTPGNLGGTLAKLALHQRVPALDAREAMQAITEEAAAPVRDFFDPEGTSGVVGEQVGALAAQGGLVKGLSVMQRLAREAAAAKALKASDALTAETMDRVGRSTADMQAADRLQRTRAAFDERTAADAAALERQRAAERYLAEHPPTVGEDAGIRRAKPIITPAPKERLALPPGRASVERPIRPEDGRLANLRRIMGERHTERAPEPRAPEPVPEPSEPAIPSRPQPQLASLSEAPPVRTIRPVTVRGRTVWEGGNEKFARMDDDALIARRNELEDRMETNVRILDRARREGRGADARRAQGAITQDNPRLREVEVELEGRGWDRDAMQAFNPNESAVVRAERDAERLRGQMEAAERSRATQRRIKEEQDYGFAEREGMQLGGGSTDFDPSTFGGTTFSAVARLAGAGTGAAVGYATGDDEGRVGRAVTGGIAGLVAASVLSRAAFRTGSVNRSQLAFSDPEVQAVLAEGAPRPSIIRRATSFPGKVATAGRSAFQKLLDDVYAVRKFGKEVGKSTALSEEASRAKGWRGFGDALVGRRSGGAPALHPTLRSAVEAAKGREADVTALLRAERAIELDDAGKGWYLTADRATAEAVVGKLAADPAVRQAADQLRNFYNHLLELRWKNGLLTDAEYTAIRQAHQQYVPFVPETEAERLVGGSSGGKLFNRTKGVRQLTEGAGGYAKVDPFQQAAEDAYRTARDVSRQRVMQTVSGIVEANPDAALPYIREITGDAKAVTQARKAAEGRVIDAIVNGERRTYEITDADFADALASVGPASQGIVVRILGPFANALKAGVTSIPSFGLANASRDAFFTTTAFQFPVRSAAAGSVTGAAIGALADKDNRAEGAAIGAALGLGGGIMARHAARVLSGLSDVLGNSALYQEWMREGGAGFGYYLGSKRDAARLIRQMQHGTGLADVVNPRSWWDALQFLNESIEQAPRVAKFKADRAAGLSPRSAVVRSREVSVDFARGGGDPMVRGLRSTSAFWNPNLQGKLKLGSVFKNPKAWAIGAASMTAPSIALWAINKDDPEYWRRPLWERNLFWLVPAGVEDDGRTKFAKIPKPFEVGFVFGSLPERLLDYAHQKDPERTRFAVEDMAKQAASGMLPVPTAIMPVAETQLTREGYDTFRQRPIVTSDVQNLPSREQYNLETAGPAIAASRAIELATGGLVRPSPQKVEHVIRGYTGTLGGRALEMGDKIGKRVGLDTRAPGVRVSPSQWARFVTHPNDFGTDDVQAMFRQFDEGERHYRKLQDLIESGDAAAASRYVDDHLDALGQYYTLKEPVQAFRKLTKQRRQIEQDRTLSPEDRRLAIEVLGEVAAEVASSAFGPEPEPALAQR